MVVVLVKVVSGGRNQLDIAVRALKFLPVPPTSKAVHCFTGKTTHTHATLNKPRAF